MCALCYLPRDAMHSADYAVAICLSVCPSQAGILSQRFSVSPQSGTHIIAAPNVMAIFRRRPSNEKGALNAWMQRIEVGRNRDFRPMSRYQKWYKILPYSYYRRRIGNSAQAFELYISNDLEWFNDLEWLISNPDFKVTILFNVK